MKKILTIFPYAENVHLTKDVGMVPFILHKYYGFDSSLACYGKNDFPNLNIETPGLKLMKINKLTGNATVDTMIFLFRNARKFDVLISFHYTFYSGINTLLFKFLNSFSKNKIVYVKLDTKEDIFDIKQKKVLRWLMNFVNIISVENTSIYKELIKDFNNLLYIPNGFYPNYDQPLVKKENIFLTVGRIGSPEKSNEVLLYAFKRIAKKLPDWNLLLIGPIQNNFHTFINDFFLDNPELVNRITFTGPINNRKELMSKYIKSKIFVLTSKWEGFALVFLEAGISGCTIVSSDILPANDVTDYERFGKIFPIDNVDALANILLDLANNSEYLDENVIAIREFYKDKFYWPTILDELNIRIETLLNIY